MSFQPAAHEVAEEWLPPPSRVVSDAIAQHDVDVSILLASHPRQHDAETRLADPVELRRVHEVVEAQHSPVEIESDVVGIVPYDEVGGSGFAFHPPQAGGLADLLSRAGRRRTRDGPGKPR